MFDKSTVTECFDILSMVDNSIDMDIIVVDFVNPIACSCALGLYCKLCT